jgi:hypothetical protein
MRYPESVLRFCLYKAMLRPQRNGIARLVTAEPELQNIYSYVDGRATEGSTPKSTLYQTD